MKQYEEIIDLEEGRCRTIIDRMRATLTEERTDQELKNRELTELKSQKLDAVGWRDKQEIDERISAFRRLWEMRQYQDSKALNQPYFGVLQIEDDDLGSLSYCLGRRSFFSRNGKVLVLDWREAPISRLYYEYDAGEFYEEEIQGRERSGVVGVKRQVETTGGELCGIKEKGIFLLRGADGRWREVDESGGALRRKEEKADHRLPEITALISREQFQSITRAESGTVILQGGAGSGKTTVGLHRIAYLTYREPERFRPDRILVVMFNRALQHYIAGVLPGLGVESGVQIETYHSWAGKVFRKAGVSVSYRSQQPDPMVTQFKKSAVVLTLIDAYLQRLLEQSREWFINELKASADPRANEIAALLQPVSRFPDYFQLLGTHPLFTRGTQPRDRKRIRSRLLHRFRQHQQDLHKAMNRDLLQKTLRAAGQDADPEVIDRIAVWHRKLQQKGEVDFADTGILMWLIQRKGLAAGRPNYAHIMVDEAQDLSEVELATLLGAADRAQSITICGDMAQKIKGEVAFESVEGFAGFIRGQQIKSGTAKVHADTLQVGYRATRPIMELAWQVLGERPSMATPRDGEPVEVIRTANSAETIFRAATVLQGYLEERPNALVAVVCRFKAGADRVFLELKDAGLTAVRRHERDDFSFQPGVLVTNAHQVKGLEFSAVLIVNPAAGHYRDDPENRMLLHVVITRAADRLWLIGNEPMAYGIEKNCRSHARNRGSEKSEETEV